MKPTRASFLEHVLLLMRTPYLWAGRTDSGVDCFGLVAIALFEASNHDTDLRAGWWTDRAWATFEATVEPRPGDLCFYGGHGLDVSHVMILLSPPAKGLPGGMVVGASGGDNQTTTLEVAAERGAFVKPKTPIRYRKPDDFRGFRSMGPYLREGP